MMGEDADQLQKEMDDLEARTLGMPIVERIDRSRLMRVERKSPPQCHGVIVDSTYRFRYRSGRDDKCERHSVYTVDGVPYCSLHAGTELVARGLKRWR